MRFHNSTLLLDGALQAVAEGTIDLSGGLCAPSDTRSAVTSTLAILPGFVPDDTVAQLLLGVRGETFDTRPDSVDKQPAHELYIARDGVTHHAALAALVRPSADRLTRLVNQRHPRLCAGRCVACTAAAAAPASGPQSDPAAARQSPSWAANP